MNDEKEPPNEKLRQLAERALATSEYERDLSSLSNHDSAKIVHELQIHQIELKMQNEQLRLSQATVEELKERYVALYNLAPVGYVVMDKGGRIRQVNEAAQRILGATEKEPVVGRLFTDFVTEDHQDAFYLHRISSLDRERPEFCEIELKRDDGSTLWVHLDSRQVREEPAGEDAVLVVIADITRRKHAEEGLRESEQRYRQIFEAVPDPMIVHRGGVIQFGNEAARRLLAIPDALDWYGLPIGKFLHPRVRASMERKMRAVEEKNVSLPFSERQFIRTDGEIVWVEVASVPTTYQGRRAVLSVGRDVTERKSAQEALRSSQTRYRNLFESMGDGVAVLKVIGDGDDFVFEEINAAAERIYELGRKSVIGKSMFDLFPLVRDLQIAEYLKEVWRTGRPQRRVISHSEAGELRFSYDTFVYKLPTGELVAVFSDQTERRRAELALRASEERLRWLFDTSGDCVFCKDASLRYTHANHVLCSLLGRKEDQILGRQDDDLYDPEIASLMNARSARVLEGQTVEVEETRPINGTTRTFLDTLVPLRDESGEITGICGVSRNVTDRRTVSPKLYPSAEEYPSAAMRLIMERARVAATSDAIVLLQGESGSGKDFIAKWTHDHSHRSGGPYFSINCAALSRELVESELFGHERGAFTGAAQRKRGMLELAEGGTILLNEIGELDLSLQSKLLVFLDNRTFVRVGGQQEIHVDARLIAASHRDLKEEVKQGRFLEPLFYRLSVFPIRVPPLRERREDIAVLVEQLLDKLATQLQIPELPTVDKQALAALATYDWPGNVRELRNVLERSLMLWRGGRFELAFPARRPTEPQGEWSYTVRYQPGRNLQEVADEVVSALYEEALRRSKGNKAEAARQLGLSRGALYRLLKRISE